MKTKYASKRTFISQVVMVGEHWESNTFETNDCYHVVDRSRSFDVNDAPAFGCVGGETVCVGKYWKRISPE